MTLPFIDLPLALALAFSRSAFEREEAAAEALQAEAERMAKEVRGGVTPRLRGRSCVPVAAT